MNLDPPPRPGLVTGEVLDALQTSLRAQANEPCFLAHTGSRISSVSAALAGCQMN